MNWSTVVTCRRSLSLTNGRWSERDSSESGRRRVNRGSLTSCSLFSLASLLGSPGRPPLGNADTLPAISLSSVRSGETHHRLSFLLRAQPWETESQGEDRTGEGFREGRYGGRRSRRLPRRTKPGSLGLLSLWCHQGSTGVVFMGDGRHVRLEYRGLCHDPRR